MRVTVSLKMKMTLAVALVVALVLAITGFLLMHSVEKGIRATISGQQFVLASENAAQLDAQFASASELIVAAATQLPLAHLDRPEQLQRVLDQRLGVLAGSVFDNGIFLLSIEGRLLAETPFMPQRRGGDYSHRDYFRQTIASGQPVISPPYRSSQPHGHPAVNFTAPVRDPAGHLIGVLAGSLDLTRDNILGRLGRIRFGESGYLYLFNTERLMIMHPDATRIMQYDVPPGANRLLDRAVAGFEGTGETINSRGVAMLTSFKRLSSVDWIVAVNLPLAEAYAPLRQVRHDLLAGLVAMLLLATVATWLFMRYLTAPLLALIAHVQRHATAQATMPPLPVATRDEIGLLGQTFNDFVAEIEERKRLAQGQLQLLQTLIDTLPQPIYYKDIAGRFLGCNRAFEEVPGCSQSELVGRTLPELVANAEGVASHQADLALMSRKGGVPFEIFENAEVYADGSVHEVLHCKAIFTDSAGSPAGMVGTMIDISSRKAFENALAEAREFSENLLQNSAVPCFVIAPDHTILSWTRACEELTGFSGVDMVGTNGQWRPFYDEPRPCLADLIIDNNFGQVVDFYSSYAASPLIPGGLQAGGWFPAVGGKRRYLLFEAAPIRNRDGVVVAAIETLNDLTAVKQIERALRDSEASYRSLIERSPDAILVHRGGRVVFANVAAFRLFVCPAGERLTGIALIDLIPPEWRDIVAERVRGAEEEGQEQPYLETQILALDGTTIDVEAGSMAVFYSGEPAVQTILRDITVRKGLQERVWRQANYDALTGIPNRLLFVDRLQQALARADRESYHVALLFIDLDRFKEVNDTLGHEAGDELLCQVAQRLGGCLRKTDTVARMGGDEFTVIMPRITEPPTMSIVARRLLDRLASPFRLAGGEAQVSGSIGIAFYPEDGKDLNDLMKAADTAMYRAKENGRNTFAFYTPGRIIRDRPEADC